MNGVWSFYDPANGRLVGRTYAGPADGLAINTPPGLVAVPGDHNHETHRVTLETGAVEQWREPRPTRDHEWDSTAGAWRLSRAAEHRAAREQIAALETKQLRPLRELLVDPSNMPARHRLADIENEIAALRQILKT